MPRVVFFTYGNERFEVGRERLAAEARATGDFTEVYTYDPTTLEPEFVAKNEGLLAAERGGGYWVWKSHLVQRLLQSMEPGDVLMYADAGCTFLSSARAYIAHARRYGAVFFRMDGLLNRDWAKGDAFEALGLDPNGIIGGESQIISGVLLLHKEPAVDALVARWAELSQVPGLVNDDPSVAPNAPTFQEHRHDQAILSLLVRMIGWGLCGLASALPTASPPPTQIPPTPQVYDMQVGMILHDITYQHGDNDAPTIVSASRRKG